MANRDAACVAGIRCAFGQCSCGGAQRCEEPEEELAATLQSTTIQTETRSLLESVDCFVRIISHVGPKSSMLGLSFKLPGDFSIKVSLYMTKKGWNSRRTCIW